MPTILIDGNNLAIQSFFANENLADTTGFPTGSIYGFVRHLKSLVDKVGERYPGEPSKILVAWDSKPSWRLDFLPEYKESRKERDPEMEQRFERCAMQYDRLREMLTLLGVGQIKADRFEADDIAGWLTQRPGNWVLSTGDDDWLQLIRPNVCVFQPQQAKNRFVDLGNFSEATEGAKDPEQFVLAKGIAGDGGDDVPGCNRIGLKLAYKFLNGEMKPTGKQFQAIKAWIEDPNGWRRSHLLVELRTIQIPAATVQLVPGAFDEKAVMDACMRHDFNSILGNFSMWIAPLKAAA